MEPVHAELRILIRSFLERHPDRADELADELLISRPSLRRWLRGLNLPHPGIARVLVKQLRLKAKAE